MRVLLFTQQFASYRTGVGTVAFALAAGLIARGHTVGVVGPKEEYANMPGMAYVPVSPFRLDVTPGRWISLGRLFSKLLGNLSGQYDIAHFTDAREAWLSHPKTIPISGRINDSYAVEWFEPGYPRRFYSDRVTRSIYYFFLRMIESYTYRRLTGLTSTSKHAADIAASAYRLDPDKIQVVYNGISTPSHQTAIPLKGKPAIIFVGANFNRKGLPILLAATSRLKPRFPDICVHVVGKDRNQKALAIKARRLNISENVYFHGWQPNHKVIDMMAGADIFALPSLTEGFGIVYLEAMSVGTPVIATSTGGAGEVFANGSEALFVRPANVSDLADAIDKIASDPATAARLMEGGKSAAARFTIEEMVKRTEESFLKLL
jgi:glycosyltransferase involved in cell wall biosynthesis